MEKILWAVCDLSLISLANPLFFYTFGIDQTKKGGYRKQK